jgi:broad specificity phosphatase PhoE
MGILYLVRHGQASFAAEDYDQLSPTGLEQAGHLGSWLADCGRQLKAIAMGTQRRHRQSVEACCAAVAAPLQEEWVADAGFNEFDHHEILVRHSPEFADRQALGEYLRDKDNPFKAFQKIFAQAVSRWIDGGHNHEYHESWPAFRDRVNEALDRLIIAAGAAGETWVFTSGGPIMVIIQRVLAIPDAQVLELNAALINTGITKLLYRPGKISLSYLNSQAHLERLKRPELITYR